MNTGVQRLVTISCTDSDDARWRRQLAHEFAENWRSEVLPAVTRPEYVLGAGCGGQGQLSPVGTVG